MYISATIYKCDDGLCKKKNPKTWFYSLPVWLFLSQVWVLWTCLCGGELPWNLHRQPPVRSHLLWRWSAKGPWKLHESTAQNWRHSGDAYRGSGKCCKSPDWYEIDTLWLLLKMLTHKGKWLWPSRLSYETFPCIIEPRLHLDLSSPVQSTHSAV